MKVLLVNGSPKPKGCTSVALAEVGKALEKEGVGTELFQLGTAPLRGCIACMQCKQKNLGKCVFDDDVANRLLAAMQAADGIVFGSPVYYAGPNGALCAALDRAFYAGSGPLQYKPASAVVCCRRGGATAALDRLNKYITINNMTLVTSSYWNMVHGAVAGEAPMDEEGMQVMRTLGQNMAWHLKSIAAAGIAPPQAEQPRMRTNFIR